MKRYSRTTPVGTMRLLRNLALPALVLLVPEMGQATASLVNPVILTWYYPDASTLYDGPQTIAVGSTFSCPGAGFCSQYGVNGSDSFSIAPDSITFTESFGINYNVAPVNAYDFSGLSFTGGATLGSYSLSTNIAGLTTSDITFGTSFIEVNMEGLPGTGTFTLTLNPSTASAPEPASCLLLGLSFTGLLALRRIKRSSSKSL